MDHDVTIYQFDGIMDNIIACNNLSFSGVVMKAFYDSRKTMIG